MPKRPSKRGAGWSKRTSHKSNRKAPKGKGEQVTPEERAECLNYYRERIQIQRDKEKGDERTERMADLRARYLYTRRNARLARRNLSADVGEMTKVRSTKALRSLQFANPARQKTEFTPGTSRREKRKLQAKQPSQSNADRQTMPIKSKVYDSQGVLIVSKRDRCDCLDEDCLGCFYPCPSCDSQKCGIECRCDRKWLYEQIEVEGGEVIRNKNVN